MQARYPIDFRVVEVNRNPRSLAAIHALLSSNELDPDSDITTFVTAWSGDRLVGCAGLAVNVIKCVVVDEQRRGGNLSAQLLAEVEQLALARGHFHLFLYTRTCYRERFQRNGFWPIAESANQTLLMENTPQGIQRYCRSLQASRMPGQRIGAIVMNANPFTLGHRYLVEQAARVCDWLQLFVVREDTSFFPFTTRLKMVQAGVAHIPNITVHRGSHYIISRATFPAYFLKEHSEVQQAWSDIDLLIFRNAIAPALGITHRFIGSEPFCEITRQYNQSMHQLLAGAVNVVEIQRISAAGHVISASEVRRLLNTQQFSQLRDMVPDTTFAYLAPCYRAELAEGTGISL